MPSSRIVVESAVERTTRVAQMASMFDVPLEKKTRLEWNVNLPLDDKPWNIGLIVGPSGCGKSTIVRHLFGKHLREQFAWPKDKSLLDAFPPAMSIKEITELLSSVGFSSPPSWLRPFGVLSNGERFRVQMARTLAEAAELAVVDEFTSVVDRTVAKIGSHAIARTVRRRGQRFIAAACHEDIEDWLQPDWIYRPAANAFRWRSLQRRPPIKIEFLRVHHSAWRLFRQHHYLSAQFARAALCFVGFVEHRPAVLCSWVHHFSKKKIMREHRTVTLPDFQGVGLGNAASEFLASAWKAIGYDAVSSTSHPAMIRHRAKSPLWHCTAGPALSSVCFVAGGVPLKTRVRGGKSRDWKKAGRDRHSAINRLIASFRYVGPALDRPRALVLFAEEVKTPAPARSSARSIEAQALKR